MNREDFLEIHNSRSGSFNYGLRFLKKDDLHYLYEILTAPEVMWGTLQIPSRQLGPLLSQWQMDVENGFDIVAEVLEGSDKGKVVGNCGIHLGTGRRRHVASLGMSCHPEYHGQGIGTALMSRALETADKWWRPVRIELEVYSDNRPAIRLYGKFGFQSEGEKKEYVIRKGAYVNGLVMGRILPEGDVPGRAFSESDGSSEDFGQDSSFGHVRGHANAIDSREYQIRPPKPSDAENLYSFYHDPEISRNAEYLPWSPPPLSKITSDLQTLQQNHVFVYASENEVLGQTSLTCGRNRMSRNGNVTLLAGGADSGLSKNISFALLGKIVELSEDWLGLHRLEAQTYCDEKIVNETFMENGFRKEARMKQASLREGVYEDKLVWARLSGIW